VLAYTSTFFLSRYKQSRHKRSGCSGSHSCGL